MPERISVRVPATSANLGCLFDCAALALGLYLDVDVTARADGAVTIAYRGVTPERVPTDETNLIARTIWDTLQSWNYPPRGFDLDIENQIPVGVGLGSSAAAIVAGLAASQFLANRPLPEEELLSLATRIEGHPDNVAGAWHGGFTVAVRKDDQVLAYSCPVPETLQLLLVVPGYAVSTEEARRVLPEQYSRQDAVHNLQRAAAVAAQLFSGRADFRSMFFDDRWHQPYRAALVPGLTDVLELNHPDLLGLCLSGAGPSVLAFARKEGAALGKLIGETLARYGVEAQINLLSADNRGAKGWRIPA